MLSVLWILCCARCFKVLDVVYCLCRGRFFVGGAYRDSGKQFMCIRLMAGDKEPNSAKFFVGSDPFGVGAVPEVFGVVVLGVLLFPEQLEETCRISFCLFEFGFCDGRTFSDYGFVCLADLAELEHIFGAVEVAMSRRDIAVDDLEYIFIILENCTKPRDEVFVVFGDNWDEFRELICVAILKGDGGGVEDKRVVG